MTDETPAPRPERYHLFGADCTPTSYVCSDLGPPLLPGEAYLDESLDSLPDPTDQVHISDSPAVQKIQNVGELKRIETLKNEFPCNASMLEKVGRLTRDYDHWRHIRGDGNCFYRAVIFGVLEMLLATGDRARWRQIISVMERISYDGDVERRNHEWLLKRLRSWTSAAQLEKWVAHDTNIDKALIAACRRLVRVFLSERADEISANGLPYSQLVDSSRFRSVEDFCAKMVDPMGCDAETPAVEALPIQLGIGLRLWMLDRKKEADLVMLDSPSPEGRIDVHVLFKPGHYDLLYARDRHAKASVPETLSAASLPGIPASQSLLAAAAAVDSRGSSLPLPRQPAEVRLAARGSVTLPSPAPALGEEGVASEDSAASALAGTRRSGLPPAPPFAPPPGLLAALSSSAAAPTKVAGSLPVEAGVAFTPTSTAAHASKFTLASAPAVPYAAAAGLPYTHAAVLPTALCSSPVKKVREGESTQLHYLPVCGVLACPQVMGGDACKCQLPVLDEPLPGPKVDGVPKRPSTLGCGHGIVFSITGLLHNGAGLR